MHRTIVLRDGDDPRKGKHAFYQAVSQRYQDRLWCAMGIDLVMIADRIDEVREHLPEFARDVGRAVDHDEPHVGVQIGVLDELVELLLGQVNAAKLTIFGGRPQQRCVLRNRLAQDRVEYLTNRCLCCCLCHGCSTCAHRVKKVKDPMVRVPSLAQPGLLPTALQAPAISTGAGWPDHRCDGRGRGRTRGCRPKTDPRLPLQHAA